MASSVRDTSALLARTTLSALVFALSGCTGFLLSPDTAARSELATRWHAPLPHDGQATDLARWWRQFDDPLVAELIDLAQAASPSLASARTRIQQARAARVAAGAALLPALDAMGNAQRSVDAVNPLGNTYSASLQSSWEVDLFGARRAARAAAIARQEGADASWHVARVAVAAETATAYLNLRACEAQLAQTRADSASRTETARLTDLATRAGFQAPATAALSRASAAQGRMLATAQQAQCDALVKALVALSSIDEPALRGKLTARAAALPTPQSLNVPSVPAELLNQRPDLHAAARELVAASADTSNARAQRWPRISLSGSITAARFESSMTQFDGTFWSLGPLTVQLPIFDAGTRAAQVDLARARYDEAVVSYRAALRQAVREVEDALLQLQSTSARAEDARSAVQGFEASLRAAESKYRGGLASLFELEDARRTALQAQSALIDLQRERVAAWISLYRALGGGWSVTSSATAALSHSTGPK